MRRCFASRPSAGSARLWRRLFEVGGHVVLVEEVDQRLRASTRQRHDPASVLGRTDHRQRRDDLGGVTASLAEVAGASVDPAHQIELGILGHRVVDGGVQRLHAARSVTINQCRDGIHAGQFASDVIRLPHLRRDWRSVVGAIRLRVVAAVHHRTTERQVHEVRASILSPGSRVTEG